MPVNGLNQSDVANGIESKLDSLLKECSKIEKLRSDISQVKKSFQVDVAAIHDQNRRLKTTIDDQARRIATLSALVGDLLQIKQRFFLKFFDT